VIDRAENKIPGVGDFVLPGQHRLYAVRLEGDVNVVTVLEFKVLGPGIIRLIEKCNVVTVTKIQEEVQEGPLIFGAWRFLQRQGRRKFQAQDILVKPARLLRVATAQREVVDIAQV
jgi:hypothetical protein